MQDPWTHRREKRRSKFDSLYEALRGAMAAQETFCLGISPLSLITGSAGRYWPWLIGTCGRGVS